MAKFRKKPVVIEAEQVTEHCYFDMVRLFGEEPGRNYGYMMGTRSPLTSQEEMQSADRKIDFDLWFRTLEGAMTASYGDWIIKDANGEFYIYKPDIFEKTYEKVEDGQD